MKGLKSAGGDGVGGCAACERGARLGAGAAALQALRRLRRLPATRSRRTSCPKTSKKGAFFKSTQADVFYTVCVKFPTGKNLCAHAAGSDQGDAVREQDHLQHPRQAQGDLVRRRQTRRLLRLQRHGIAAELVVVGFDTATDDTAVCAARDGEVLHESLLGLSAEGKPRHATVLLEEVERAAAAAGGWGAVGPDRRRPRARLVHRRADRDRHRAGPGGERRPAGGGRLHARRDRAGRCASSDGEAGRLPRRPRRSPRRGVRGAVLGRAASGSGSRWSPRPADLAERVAELPQPPLAAGSGALRFRQELARRGVEIPDDADPVHRVAARHICALAAAGRPGTPARSPRST